METTWQALCALDEVSEGKMTEVRAGEREILLCHTRAGVFALDAICTHAFARMIEGRLRGTRLICPLHGASFDVRDGRVLGAPAVSPLHRYDVRIVGGQIEVALPAPTS